VNPIQWVIQTATDWVFSAVNALLDLLPNAADLGLEAPTGWIRGYNVLDTFLPLHEALAAIAVILGVYVVVFGWRLAVTVYHLIPKPGMGT